MKRQRQIADVAVFLLLAVSAVIMIYPFVWMLFTSFKPRMHIYLAGLLPQVWDFSHYVEIWTHPQFSLVRGFLNTILYSVPPVIVGSLVSVAAAFAFAKLRFKGRDALFLVLLGSLMIPFPSIMIPQFVMFSQMNLVNTPWPLILPKLTGNVLMIFFLRQFLRNMPDSIIEAAKIDGAGYFGIYRTMILNMAGPALAAHGVLWFIGAWNDYLAPTILIRNPNWHPVTVMIAKLNEMYAIQTNVPRIMAGSVVLLVPVLILFGIFQRYIIESVMFSSIKE